MPLVKIPKSKYGFSVVLGVMVIVYGLVVESATARLRVDVKEAGSFISMSNELLD
jgi:hypothetical protein